MKYIRTYETEEKFLTDKDSTSRGFRLKPTLYKYSEAGDHVHLEIDDPRKHGDSTYIEITLGSDTEFSFYIGNVSDDTQTTMTCSIDWGDDTIETKTITKDDYGFKLVHSYVAGSYKIELYGVERDYSVIGNVEEYISLVSPVESVMRVVLGSGVVSIGGDAFNECESLISVYIPESVTNIGDLAFIGCISLTSVHISEGVVSIGKYAFSSCSSLKSIYIPNSVTSLGESAFGSNPSLKSIYIPESVTNIGRFVVWNCDSLTSFYIPRSMTTLISGMFQKCNALESIYIPESITSIGRWCFEGCTSLTSVHIPNSVTSLGYDMFARCTSLPSITIPESVTFLDEYVFNGCSSLISISSLNPIAPTLNREHVSPDDEYPDDMFYNLPTNGILHVKPGATGYDAWLSLLPSGWTIVEDL